MCDISQEEIGTSLNGKILGKMPSRERQFFLDLLSEFNALIRQRYQDGFEPPFAPSPSLREKFRKAVGLYNGTKYKQVRDLAGLFLFE